jgi:hypothetical protein
MAKWRAVEPGPLGCEWEDIFTLKEWVWKGRVFRSLKIKQKVSYVTVDLETGEIKDFVKPSEVQLSLFN